MGLEALNLHTIHPVDLERTMDDYVEVVLDVPAGDRPPLGFPGDWLDCGDVPTVPLIGPNAAAATHPERKAVATGRLDHIVAFPAPPRRRGGCAEFFRR